MKQYKKDRSLQRRRTVLFCLSEEEQIFEVYIANRTGVWYNEKKAICRNSKRSRSEVSELVLEQSMSVEDKLSILADAAKYDVACTSSGMQRNGKQGELGNSVAAGICHSFSGDGRCISLLKVLFTNECVFDCKYCINRSSNDVPRASFTPRELCELTIGFYKRNYIEGLFLSSGVLRSPDYTMELICQTLRMLREEYHFRGYIHCKAIPGADPLLVEYAGWYADRMSVNLELPTNEGLRMLAPHKTRKNILQPMRQIQSGIEQSRRQLGYKGGNQSAYSVTQKLVKQEGVEQRFFKEDVSKGISVLASSDAEEKKAALSPRKRELVTDTFVFSLPEKMIQATGRGFVAAGQSTQMIIGATPETDFHLVSVAEALYRRFDLKRVFYSAFIKVNEDSLLPDLPGGPPLLREHRLYQADFLMRFYGFRAGELLTEERPNFNQILDPKCDWAVHHPEVFPVEVLTADYFMLLRVPGIGPKSARRIVQARRHGALAFQDLKKMGVVLKRAKFFITCGGNTMEHMFWDSGVISRCLSEAEKIPSNLREAVFGRQMSLLDFPQFGVPG